MKIAVISPEPLGARMSGIGIRMLELARVLARRHEVRLGVMEADPGFNPGLPIFHYKKETVAEHVSDCAAVLVQGEPANYLLSQKFGGAVIVDLYDPFMVEALSYDAAAHRFAKASTDIQLQKGDYFLCAHEAQRHFYTGCFYAMGRLSPEAYQKDPELESLIGIVPFGVPGVPPALDGSTPLRSRLRLRPEAKLLFFGTFYDWYDTDLLQAVLEDMLRDTDVHFAAVAHLRSSTTPQKKYAAFRAWAEQKSVLGSQVHILDWIPYEERLAAYRDCTAGMNLYAPSLETSLSFRTRILDFLYAGLPVAAVRGGGLDRAFEGQPGLHLCAPDPADVTRVLRPLLDHPADAAERGRLSTAARERFSWEKTAAPLMAYLDRLPSRGTRKPHWWEKVLR